MAAAEPAFESVITEAMRRQIGVEGPPALHEVTTSGVRLFARAVGYDDPVFYDQAEARQRGYRDLPAPVGYLGTTVFHPATHDPTFSRPRDAEARVPSPYTRILNGGTDVEYLSTDICAGDLLSARSKLESLTERFSQALGGAMLIQVTATTFTNQQGQAVAVMRGTVISYGPKRDGSS